MKRWKHIFKLDPAKNISDENLKQLCHSGTDAIIIGGTDNVTYENVYELFTRVRRYHLPTRSEERRVGKEYSYRCRRGRCRQYGADRGGVLIVEQDRGREERSAHC